MQERIRVGQRMETLGALSGGIAHDLNNVLAPVLLSCDLLTQSASREERADVLEVIRGCATRGGDLIRQLLLFARGEKTDQLALDLRALLAEVAAIMNETFPRNISIQLDSPRGVWRTKANPTQIHQVIMNLCVNSRDALVDGGELFLSVRNEKIEAEVVGSVGKCQVGEYVAIGVRDTGVGIAKEDLQKIFEPLFTTKRERGGTGLGLATVKEIVEDYDGFLVVESTVGQGSYFRVFLPSYSEEVVESVAGHPIPESRMGDHQLIAIVDEEVMIRKMVALVLERSSYRVEAFSSGLEAMRRIRESGKEFALIISDLDMPELDGISFARQVRESGRDVPIVLTSGHELSKQRVANEMGSVVQGFIDKPFSSQTLLDTVDQIFWGDQ